MSIKQLRYLIFLDTIKILDLLLLWAIYVMTVSYNNYYVIIPLLFIAYFVMDFSNGYMFNRLTSIKKDIRSCINVSVVTGIYILFVSSIFKIHHISNYNILSYIGYSFIVLLGVRLGIHIFMYFMIRVGMNKRYVYIVGTNKRAIMLARELPKLGYLVKGFIDTGWRSGTFLDKPLVTDYLKVFREDRVDEIIICLPIKNSYKYIEDVIVAAEKQGILTRMYAELFNLELAKLHVESVGHFPFLTIITGNMHQKSIIIKNIIDFVGSFVLLTLLSPLFLLIAIAIKLTSKGPVFFKQDRVGLNKKIFKIYKFRTMVVDAERKQDEIEHLNERKNEAAFKIKNDPRVTKIGKILRKLSLDELPQLINVLKGDMSLVGPRPLPLRDYKRFNNDIHRRRFSVKPGITCIWQISGRDNIPFDKWMELDNYYIDNWSLLLDLEILIKTIPSVLLAKGAS